MRAARKLAVTTLATTAFTLGGLAAATVASAGSQDSQTDTRIECGNPLVILSPGTHIDRSNCHSATVVHQQLDNNNSNNVPVLSTLLGTQNH